MFSSLKKLMWFLGKNTNYTLTENSLLIQNNLDNEVEMNFFESYLYRSGRRKGGYQDVNVTFDKMKKITKNNKGNLVLTTSSLLIGKVIIPRELENKIRTKIK